MGTEQFSLIHGIGKTIIDEIAKIESSANTVVTLVKSELDKIDEEKILQDSAIRSYNQQLNSIVEPTGTNMTIDAIKRTMGHGRGGVVKFSADIATRSIANYQYFPAILGKFIVSTESARAALSDLEIKLDAVNYTQSFKRAIYNLEYADQQSATDALKNAVTSVPTPTNPNSASSTPSSDKTWTYYIKPGDTLWALARKYHTTVEELARLNNISNPNLIYAGAALLIPLSGVASGNASSTSSQNSGNQTQSSSVQPQGNSANAGNSSVNVPYYSQGDSRWSGKKIGTKTIGNVGCLVTSLAMAESSSTNTTITPDQMVGRLKFDNNSLYWSSAEKLGYNCESCPQTTKGLSTTQYQTICEQLKKGHPVVIGGAANGNDKGNNQHWVVITGYTGDGTSFSPSDFTINDPGSSSRKTLADFFNYKPYPVRMLYKNG